MRWVAVCAIGLAGCTLGAEQYQQDIDTWVGHSTDALVVSWGPPTSETTLSDGRRVLQYVSEDFSATDGGRDYFRCDTLFVVGAESRIEETNFRGDCASVFYGGLINFSRPSLRAPTRP